MAALTVGLPPTRSNKSSIIGAYPPVKKRQSVSGRPRLPLWPGIVVFSPDVVKWPHLVRPSRKHKPTFEISPSPHKIRPAPRSRNSQLRMPKTTLT